MPAYAESFAYAEERLQRLLSRFRYSYSQDYRVTRAANSSTRRMTNLNKLRSWEAVLRSHGYEQAAQYCQNRIDGLEAGTITPPVRRRLARTQVAHYHYVAPRNPNADGPSYVEYEYVTGSEDV